MDLPPRSARRGLPSCASRRIAFCPLHAAAPDLLDYAERVTAWLERLAQCADQNATDTRFPSLAEAQTADAKNYRATARDGLKAIAKAKGQSND